MAIPPNSKHSYVYQKLTEEDGANFNLIHNVAYALYKQRKIEFYKIHSKNPTQAQLDTFHKIYMQPEELNGLKIQAKAIVEEFLTEALKEDIKLAEDKINQELTAQTKDALQKFNSRLDKDFGLIWWFKQVGISVVSTVLAALLLGLAYLALFGSGIIGVTPTSLPKTQATTPK